MHVVDTAEDDPLRAGLTATAAAADDVVLVHDPARPFVPAAVLRSAIDTVDTHVDVAVPVLPVADTVKVVDADGVVRGTRDRTHLRHVQSPLAFRAAALERALDARRTSDPAELLADPDLFGGEIRTVPGDPLGMRIATPFDVAVIEALLTTETPA